MTLPLEIIPYCQRTNLNYDDVRGLIIQQTSNSNMFIVLYYCLLIRVQPLSLAWADLHNTESFWALFQGLIVKFQLGYTIFYLGLLNFSTQQLPFQAHKLSTSFGSRAHYTNLVGHLGMKINASKIISTHQRSPIKNSL